MCSREYLTFIYRCTQTCLQKKWNVAILFLVFNLSQSISHIFICSLWALLHYTLEKINIFNKQSSIFFLHDSHQKLVWGLSTETRSNDILLAVKSELTYFMAGKSLRLQMKQKKILLHSILYKIISIFHHAHRGSCEWHFPGPTVKHGLFHMQTHRQNACNCLVHLSFIPPTPTCALSYSEASQTILGDIKLCPLHVSSAYHNSGKLLWL